MLPTGSSAYRSISSGWLSGQVRVMMNSALVSILPDFASGFITNSAMKKRKATTCSALNSMTLNGSNFSRGYFPTLSIDFPLENGHDENLGEVGGKPEQLRRRPIEHVILRLHQDRADKATERGVHRDGHAVAHQPHRTLHRRAVGGIEPGDRSQHQNEADDGAEKAELHERIARERAELVRTAQCIGEAAQQQGLIEPMPSLQLRLENEIADMRGDLPGRKPCAVDSHTIACDHTQVRHAPADQRKHALCVVHLARDHSGAHEAMRRGQDV